MNKKTSLIVLTSLTATAVALCAAFFSVTGIAKLFAGASLAALVMAGTLEFGKIVGISFLYQYWKEIPRLLKAYLTLASVVLMLITSVGIYGFLSSAYQATADQLSVLDQQVAVIDLRKERYQEELDLYLQERERLSQSIESLNSGLAGNVIQYVDRETGQLITTTSSANRSALQEQLRIATEERSNLAQKIEVASDSITSLETQAIDLSANNELAAEIGPLRFVSNLTGWEMDQVVNIFALMIIFVFDPLAIALVISVNFLLKHNSKEEEKEEEVKHVDFFSAIKVPETTIEHELESENEVPVTIDEENYYSSEEQKTEEPYEIYVPKLDDESDKNLIVSEQKPVSTGEESATPEDSEKITEEMILRKYMDLNRNGIPDWMEPDFDWNNIKLWANNPIATLYKRHVRDKRGR